MRQDGRGPVSPLKIPSPTTKDERPTTAFMTWIKICGTTNLEDALMAVEAGADALGFVFYENSPRNVTPEVVREIVKKLPEKIEKVGVLPGVSFEECMDIARRCGLTGVQFYPSIQTIGDGSRACAGRPHAEENLFSIFGCRSSGGQTSNHSGFCKLWKTT